MRNILNCGITEYFLADKNDNSGTPLAGGNEIFDRLSTGDPFKVNTLFNGPELELEFRIFT